MKTKYTFDEAYSLMQDRGYEIETLTYGANGYPKFCGTTRYAATGFDTWQEVEEFAEEIGGAIERIHQRDGWRLWESEGSCYSPFKQSECEYVENIYGSECEAFDPESAEERLEEYIECDCDEDEDKINIAKKEYEECLLEYNKKKDNEIVIMSHGQYVNTVTYKSTILSYSHDTHSYAIAVVIDSEMHRNNEEKVD